MRVRWRLGDRGGFISRRWSAIPTAVGAGEGAIAFEVGPSMTLWLHRLSTKVVIRVDGLELTYPRQITGDHTISVTSDGVQLSLAVTGLEPGGLVSFGSIIPDVVPHGIPEDPLREAVGALTAAHSPPLVYRLAERWRRHALAAIGRWLVSRGFAMAKELEHRSEQAAVEPVVWALLRSEPACLEWADALAMFMDAETRRYSNRGETNLGGYTAVTQAPALALEIAREHCDLLVRNMVGWLAVFDPSLAEAEARHVTDEASVALAEALEAASAIEGVLQDASGEIIEGDLVLSRDAVDARFPALTAVRGSIRAVNCEKLQRLDLPNLRTVRGIVVEGSQKLVSLNLPELTTVLGDVVLRSNSSLVSVSMPKLEAVRAVLLDSNPMVQPNDLVALDRLGTGMVTVSARISETDTGELVAALDKTATS